MFNRVVAYATDFADWAVNNVSVYLYIHYRPGTI